MILFLGCWVEVAGRTGDSTGTAPELGIGPIFPLFGSQVLGKNNAGKEEPGRMDHVNKGRSHPNLSRFQHNLNETTKDLCNLRLLMPGACWSLVL